MTERGASLVIAHQLTQCNTARYAHRIAITSQFIYVN